MNTRPKAGSVWRTAADWSQLEEERTHLLASIPSSARTPPVINAGAMPKQSFGSSTSAVRSARTAHDHLRKEVILDGGLQAACRERTDHNGQVEPLLQVIENARCCDA